MEGSLTSNSAYSGVQKRSYQLENYCSQVQTLTTCKEWRHKTIQQHLCILHSVRNIGKHCRKDILNVLSKVNLCVLQYKMKLPNRNQIDLLTNIHYIFVDRNWHKGFINDILQFLVKCFLAKMYAKQTLMKSRIKQTGIN